MNMATPKKKSAAVTTNRAAAARGRDEEEMDEDGEAMEAAPFDYNAFFKEAGLKYTEQDLIDVGALMPIYASAHAYEEKWAPLCGKIVNRVELKVAKDEAEEDRQWRWFFVIEAKAATKSLSGTGDDREVIDIEPGDYTLMPESGSLKNKDRLKIAATDPDFVHTVVFRVVGQLDLGKPGRNPMWEIEANLLPYPEERRGRYSLENTSRTRTPELPAGPQNGSITNKSTGRAVDRLVG